jgi:dipeptidyl-peptidase-4
MKRYLLFALLVGLTFPLLSQRATYPDLTAALRSGGVLAGRNGPASVNWIDGGDRFSFIPAQAGVIRTYDPAKNTEETVFSAEGLTFPGTDDPFQYRSFRWSADFQYLLFQTNFRPVWRYSGDADYYLYRLSDKSLELVAKDARTAELSPDGKKVAYERGGDLYVLDLASKQERRLTDDAQEQVYNGRFGWVYEEEFGLVQAWLWSPDSRYIAFWQSDEREIPIYQMTDFSGPHAEYERIPYPRVGDPVPPVRIGVIDLNSLAQQWVNLDLDWGYVPRLYWTSKPGQLALAHLNRKQNHLRLFFADSASGNIRQIMEETDNHGWIDVFDFFAGILHYFFFPADSEEFYWISGRSGHNHLYRYDYQGKLLNQVTKGDWDVVRVEAFDAKKRLVYFTSTEASPLERHLYVIGRDGKNKKKLSAAPGRHQINMSPNAKYYIDIHSSTDRPKRVELWSTDGKLIKTLEDNSATLDFLEKNAYSPRELMRFTTSDGQALDIYLVRPHNFDSTRQYPLLLNIYGGPGAQSVYNEFGASGWEQYLSQQGYVVASVNNRGSGGYGQDFMEIVYEQLGVYESKDFVETAQYLARAFPWVDSARMAIQGHSYGGYSSSYTMVTHPGVFKVALVGAPVTDQRLYDNIYTERYMGLLPENEDKYIHSAPITHAANFEGKMLIAHSLMDDNVHVVNTYQFIRALTDAGKDVDLRIYPPGNHSVAYSWESYLLLYSTYLNYLNTHLGLAATP